MRAPTWGEMMADITLQVTIGPAHPMLWKMRVKLATALIAVAAWIMGLGGAEINEL